MIVFFDSRIADQHPYDKEFFANYGHTRSSTHDALYQQQPSTTMTQPAKDTPITSKLSPTAAAFSQGAPLTASPSTSALYMNPVAFSMTNYLPSVSGSTHQDRYVSYSSADNRVSILSSGAQQEIRSAARSSYPYN